MTVVVYTPCDSSLRKDATTPRDLHGKEGETTLSPTCCHSPIWSLILHNESSCRTKSFFDHDETSQKIICPWHERSNHRSTLLALIGEKDSIRHPEGGSRGACCSRTRACYHGLVSLQATLRSIGHCTLTLISRKPNPILVETNFFLVFLLGLFSWEKTN